MRDAVIALAARDQVAPLRLAALDEILPGKLKRCFDRLGAAADIEDMTEAFRRVRGEIVGKLFGHLCREETGMRVFDFVELRAHGVEHVAMRMAETRHRGAAGGVDIILPARIANKDAAARHRRRILMIDRAMQYVGHVWRRPVERG